MNKVACYRHAQGFLETGKQLLGIKDGVAFLGYFFAPCVTNLTFSCELSLKLILFIELGIEERNEHKLINLYNRLSERTRTRINRKYCEKDAKCTFDECMDSNNNNFVNFRYLHEESHNGSSSHPWDLRKLAESMVEVAGEKLREDENNAH